VPPRFANARARENTRAYKTAWHAVRTPGSRACPAGSSSGRADERPPSESELLCVGCLGRPAEATRRHMGCTGGYARA
jgi:hypothetical protein